MHPLRKSAWADNLRVWATFSVIVIHVSMESRTPGFNADLLYGALSRSAVPVFFMLTGALLLGREHALGDFLKKRLLRLGIPALFWSLVYIAFSLYQKHVGGQALPLPDALQFAGHSLRVGSYFHMWYVYMILGLYLFIPFLSRAVRNSPPNELLFFLAIWFIDQVLSIPALQPYRPYIYLRNFSGFAGYMVLGYYLSILPPVRKGIWKGLALFIAGAFITGIGNYLIAMEDGVFPATLLYEYIRPNIILMAVGAFLFAKSLPDSKSSEQETISGFGRLRTFISDHSYGIYFVHVLSLVALNKLGISWHLVNPFVGIPVTAIVCLALSGGLIWVLRKLPFGTYWAG